MFLRQTVAPATEPLSLSEAKAHLRVDIADDDTYIAALIAAARIYAEKETGRSLITQQWQLVHDSFPGPSMLGIPAGVRWSLPGHAILLDRSPVISVETIKYLDMSGTLQTMPSTDYVVDLNSEPARITPVFGKIWPITLPQIGAVKVDFTAGYGNASAVPQGIKTWMLLRIGTLYENREEVAVMTRGKIEPLPFVDHLLDGYRVLSM